MFHTLTSPLFVDVMKNVFYGDHWHPMTAWFYYWDYCINRYIDTYNIVECPLSLDVKSDFVLELVHTILLMLLLCGLVELALPSCSGRECEIR